ncbi:dihydroneopterin aldolase [soil metagenome]|jgi:dihydroneopterin aldolase
MITISLHGAEFFAYHGFYPEEQKLGAKFIVDIEVGFSPGDLSSDKLANTVDYEKLYNLVSVEMKQTRKLIETVAHAIANKIKSDFPVAEQIKVSLKKLNPPLSGKVEYSGITLTL